MRIGNRQLTRQDFTEFFSEVTGHRPFAWQERLLDHLLSTGCWPHRISAPTGAGKTSVIDVHVFAVALSVAQGSTRVPRRLAMVVDRRALVDDQYEHARDLQNHLTRDGDADSAAATVSRILRDLRQPSPGAKDTPFLIARLRGGQPPSTQWRYEPTACAIICATPDMWGSRLLLRGYGSARGAWPVEAGLLGVDAAVIVDEAHLSRQLIATARRIAQLQERDEDLGVPRLQCVETSATPASSSPGSGVSDIGVQEADLLLDGVLAQRMNAAKELRIVGSSTWPTQQKTKSSYIAELVDLVVDLTKTVEDDAGPATIGCFVNTVRDAVAVHSALEQRGFALGEDAVLICGRMRRFDLDQIRHVRHPGLLDIKGSAGVRVLVTTQSLEVGIDIDLAGAVSELAPGAALAQRAGRVNRLGQRRNAVFTILGPDGILIEQDGGFRIQSDEDEREIKDAHIGPYDLADLAAAHRWLRRLEDGQSIAPWVLALDPPPGTRTRLLHRLERWNGWHLANTSVPCGAEPDLDVWLSDDLDTDIDVGVVVRRHLTGDPSDIEYLRATRIHAGEVFPARIGETRVLIEQFLELDDPPPLYRVAEGSEPERVLDATLRPGDILVIDARAEILDGQAGILTDRRTHTAEDVLEETGMMDGALDLRIGTMFPIARHLSASTISAIVEQCREAGVETRAERQAFASLISEAAQQIDDQRWAGHLSSLGTALKGPFANFDIQVISESAENGSDSERESVNWVVVTDRRIQRTDDQIELVAEDAKPVPLDIHLRDVSARARATAARLGLPAHVIDAMTAAGLYHDRGKTDRRFQTMLGSTDEPLAKSGHRRIGEVREAQAMSGLPRGWRHEQRSLLDCDPAADITANDLILRLVGTHHGHGRPLFPQASDRLLEPTDDRTNAQALFDEGYWNTVIDRTHERFGVWGCAYLESVFRASDVQISREPSQPTPYAEALAATMAPRHNADRTRTFQLTMNGADPRFLASHLALFGIGALLQSSFGHGQVRVAWTSSMDPRPVIEIVGTNDWQDIYDALMTQTQAAHAWLDESFPDGTRKPRGLMSPRRGIAPDDWPAFVERRHAVVDALDAANSLVHLRMLGGLGEPSYWHRNRKGEHQPDYGASRFDTQPRNSGSELVTNRLRKDAAAVERMGPDQLLVALTAANPVSDDPSACAGLAPNGTFGSAISWFAHWGMALCPVAPRANLRSLTTTFLDTGPAMCALPMTTSLLGVSRLRDLLATHHAGVVVAAGTPDGRRATSEAWLRAQGIQCVARFSFRNDGTASAAKWIANLGDLVTING